MNRLQKIILSLFSPQKITEIQDESQRWHMICPRCGWKISVWDAGGIRWKATSYRKKTRGRCGGCGQSVWFAVESIPVSENHTSLGGKS